MKVLVLEVESLEAEPALLGYGGVPGELAHPQPKDVPNRVLDLHRLQFT